MHDVLVLTETNLQSHILSGELGFPDAFSVLRKDRSLTSAGKASGGGVLIAASKLLNPTEICVQSDLEVLYVSLAPRVNCKVLLVGAYIPPNSPLQIYLDFSHQIEELLATFHYDYIHILGDFNVPVSGRTDLLTPHVNSPLSILSSMAAMFDLDQVNDILNRRGVILDFIFTSSYGPTVLHDPDPIVPEDVHHPALNFVAALPIPANSKSLFVKNFRKCNLQLVHDDLSLINFDELISEDNVNLSFEDFISAIRDSVINRSPLKRCGPSKFPLWFSAELKQLTILKKCLHKNYKQTLDDSAYRKFSSVRAQCKAMSKDCLAGYVNHVQDILPQNPKIFWSYLRAIRCSGSTPPTVRFEGSTSVDDQSSADLFADFFSSVFGEDDVIPDASPAVCPSFLGASSFSTIEESEVHQALSTLDISKGCGPDSVPPSVVKYCRDLLASPLTKLFNMSLSKGVFPDVLKKSYIVPIHKKGPSDDVKNYRPIAILSVVAKIFERIVLPRVSFAVNPFITPSQHGFRKGRSSATNLMIFVTDIHDAFGERCQVDAVELDFAKAFDCVSHKLLLDKLKSYGFNGCMIQWFSSYLHGRRLQVRYNGAFSSDFIATSGVPQGSLLGPILFTIFINDVVSDLRCSFQLFADDLKLYQRISSESDLDVLQDGIESVSRWCSENKMALNIDKCVCITFHRTVSPLHRDYLIDGRMLARSSEVKDLGVVLTQNLSWDRHVQSVCNKALRNLGLIHRLAATFTRVESLRLLYCSLVRPHLEYCDVIWSPHQIYLKDELEGVQRRFVRLVGARLGFKYLDVPLAELSSLLRLPHLEVRRFCHDVQFLRRLVISEFDCPTLLERVNFRVPSGTRSRDLFARVTVSSNYALNSPITRIQRHGNSIDAELDFFGSNGSSFKRRLHESQLCLA